MSSRTERVWRTRSTLTEDSIESVVGESSELATNGQRNLDGAVWGHTTIAKSLGRRELIETLALRIRCFSKLQRKCNATLERQKNGKAPSTVVQADDPSRSINDPRFPDEEICDCSQEFNGCNASQVRKIEC